MAIQTFPTLPGIAWSVEKKFEFSNKNFRSLSGTEVRSSYWQNPLIHWVLKYEFLRQGTIGATAYAEMKTLAGFFLERKGGFEAFYFNDPADDLTLQNIGTGNGSNLVFYLKAYFGGYSENILKQMSTPKIYVAGVLKTAVTHYNITSEYIVTFTAGNAPANGAAVTATYSYYWLARFEKDKGEFEQFCKDIYKMGKCELVQVR